MDSIRIEDLEVFSNHGVYPEENKLGQKFMVSLTLYTSTRAAGLSDELAQSIDYGAVSHEVHSFLRRNTYKLIERAAEELAVHLLKTNPLVQKLEVQIKKPWAPIGLSLRYASVAIERGWHTAYIAVGSNMGDTQKTVQGAIAALRGMDDVRVTAVSDLIVTKPYGGVAQDDFLNGALALQTLLPSEELLARLHSLEQAAGREREVRWGPRTLDLDILLYDDTVVDMPNLHIPHIDMHNRRFVLEPLVQIAPHVRHPLLHKTAVQLLEELGETQ